jgi:hypothetical protein
VYEFTPYALPTAATTLLLLVSGTVVFVRRPSRLSAAFLGLAVIASLWQAAFTFMYLATDAHTALFWARLAYLGVPFLAPAVYQFSLELLRKSERRIVPIVGAWALAAFFSALGVGTNLLISRVQHYWWGYYPRYGVATSIPFLIFFFGYLMAALAELLYGRPAAEGGERRRIWRTSAWSTICPSTGWSSIPSATRPSWPSSWWWPTPSGATTSCR